MPHSRFTANRLVSGPMFSESLSGNKEYIPPEGPGETVISRRNEQMGQELAKLHEEQVQGMAKYFKNNIENLLGEIVNHQQTAENESAFNAYGALFMLANQIYKVFTSNYKRGLEPLMLNLLRVMNGVYIRSEVTGREFFVEYQSHFNPEEINHALYNLVEMTIGELPELAPGDYMNVRNIVNPIVETAGSLIERFGAWLAPAVTHINNRIFAYVNPVYQHTIEKIPHLQGMVVESLYNLPTIEKIYLGDSIIQVIELGYGHLDFLIETLCQSSSFAKMVADIGIATINGALGSIESIRSSLMAIQGMSFNLLVFTIILTQQIYNHRRGDENLGEYLKDLCITYASRALFKLNEAYAETEHGRAVAIQYGNIIYHSINLTIDAVKQIHLMGYAANPFLLSGFVAYTVGTYINSFHSEKPMTLVQAFDQTYRTVFGEELPEAFDRLKQAFNDLGTEIETQVAQIKANQDAAQALLALMGNMGEPAQDQGVAPPQAPINANQAAINAAQNAGLLPGGLPNNSVGAASAPANNNRGTYDFGGGKARRRKTIKKKHAKKAHKRKSKKAGKVRKVKKARKSKAKKAHKGKRYTKRRS